MIKTEVEVKKKKLELKNENRNKRTSPNSEDQRHLDSDFEPTVGGWISEIKTLEKNNEILSDYI